MGATYLLGPAIYAAI